MIKKWNERLVGHVSAGMQMQIQLNQRAMQEEIDELRAALASSASAWISIDERMPSEGQNVTILYWPFGNHKNEQQAGVAQHCNGNFYTEDGDEHYFPSHWMPMPIPPGEQK